MNFKCPKCKKGRVSEESPGVDWDVIANDCIARNDLVCDNCGTKFNIFFNLDRVEIADANAEQFDEIKELDSGG